MNKDKQDDQLPPEETKRRREAALKRMLSTPHQPQKLKRDQEVPKKRGGAKEASRQVPTLRAGLVLLPSLRPALARLVQRGRERAQKDGPQSQDQSPAKSSA